MTTLIKSGGADLGEGCMGWTPAAFQQLVFCERKTMWTIGVEVKHEKRWKNLC